MLINNNGINLTGNKSDRGDAPASPVSSKPSQTQATDQVDISDSAKLLAQSSSSEVVDSAKIEAIRQAIIDGSYGIDAEAVAEKLLESDELI